MDAPTSKRKTGKLRTVSFFVNCHFPLNIDSLFTGILNLSALSIVVNTQSDQYKQCYPA